MTGEQDKIKVKFSQGGDDMVRKLNIIDYLLNWAKNNREVKITYCGKLKSNKDLWQITTGNIWLALQGTKKQVIKSLFHGTIP